MTSLSLIARNDPRLHQRASDFDLESSDDWNALIEAERILTTFNKNAVGIALPQLGVLKRAFIIRWAGKTKIVINPTITLKSGKLIADVEGCLSFPNYKKAMKRWTQLSVSYINNEKKEIKETLKNFEARIFAHEFDHLEGRTIG